MAVSDVWSRLDDLDRQDPVASLRGKFVDNDPDRIYLDGNSLGRLPVSTSDFVKKIVATWGDELVRAWSSWVDWPQRVGGRLAETVLGAHRDEVAVSDSTSVNFYKLAAAALDARRDRGTVLVDPHDFPTNKYIIEGLAKERGCRVSTLPSDIDEGINTRELGNYFDDNVALVAMSAVNYRSGALCDIKLLTSVAHSVGALTLFDLSHAAGVVPLKLARSGVDLAVGCTYKYLNAGHGAPGFLYVRRDLQASLQQPIWGWFGHRNQFDMEDNYVPANGIEKFLTGTPPILSLAPLEPALDLVERVGMEELNGKAVKLGQFAIELADAWLSQHGFRLASPRDAAARGAHVSLEHPDAWRVCQALTKYGVIADYRNPDRLRIGLAPAYTSFHDVAEAFRRLVHVMERGEFESMPLERARVT